MPGGGELTHKPMYPWSREEAQNYGELDLWRESYKENCRCARAIEQAISRNFNGYTLNTDCLQEILEEFGNFGKYSVLVLLAMANVFFVIYDGAVKNITLAYRNWFRPKILKKAR